DDVRVGNKIEVRRQIQVRFLVDPSLGQIEWRLVVVLSGALIQPGEIGKRRNLFSVLLVSAHGSVGKPERESRIWKTAGAFDGKARPGNFGIRLYLHFFLRIVSLSGLACWPVYETSEIEHRFVRHLQRSCVFGVEIL